MTAVEQDQPLEVLRRVAVRGAAWNYAGSGVTLVSQVFYTALTARLISPSGFGAYATAQAAVALVGYFALTTIGAAVLRRADGPRELIGSAFLVSAVAASLAGVAVAVVAPVWAGWWHAPQAVTTIRVFSLAVVAMTASAVPLALLRRDLRFRAAALVESLSQVGGMAIGAAAAVAIRGPAALAAGQAAGATFVLLASLLLVRRQLTLAVSRRELRYLLGFSSQVSSQNLVFYAINTVPSWLIARSLGSATLGFYSRASLLVGLPVTHLSTGLTKALYPLYARASADSRKTAALLEDALGTASVYVWPAFAALAGAAPSVVALLLGPGWSRTAALLPIVAFAGCFSLPSVILFNAAEAFRWMRFTWTLQAAWVAATAAGLGAVVAADGGAAAVVSVVALLQVAVHAVQVAYFSRRGFLTARVLLRRYAASAAAAVAVFAVVRLVAIATHPLAVVIQAVAEVAAVAVLAAGAFVVRRALAPPPATVTSDPSGRTAIGIP